MNERIRKLWDEAANATAAYPSGQNTSWETQVNFINKFAELLENEFEVKHFSAGYTAGRSDGVIETVRECIDWCNAHSSVDGTAQKITESIKQHFGVE